MRSSTAACPRISGRSRWPPASPGWERPFWRRCGRNRHDRIAPRVPGRARGSAPRAGARVVGARRGRGGEQPHAVSLRQRRPAPRPHPRRLGRRDPGPPGPRPRPPGLRPARAGLRSLLLGARGAGARRAPPAGAPARPRRERLPPARGADHARGRPGRSPRRAGARVTAAVAVGAVLAGLAGVKALEARLPRFVVRAGILLFVLGPLAGLAYAMWTLWRESFEPVDLALPVVLSVVTGLGTSLGYHRLLTHRSFSTTRWLKGAFLAAGAMAVPSTPVDWAARHLEHHAHSDREGDPHSPADGLLHAHVGWIFSVSPAKRERYCRRLLDDPVVMAIARTSVPGLAP